MCVGEHVIDVSAVALLGADPGEGAHPCCGAGAPELQTFIHLGPEVGRIARKWLIEAVTNDVHRESMLPHVYPVEKVTLHLPST